MPYFSFLSSFPAYTRSIERLTTYAWRQVRPIKMLNISCNSSFNNVLYFPKNFMHFTQNILLYYIIHFAIFQVLYSVFIKKSKNKSPFIRATVNYCHRLTNYDPNFTVFVFFCLFGQGLGSTEKSGSQRQKLSPKLCNVSPKTQQFFGCFVDFPCIRHT